MTKVNYDHQNCAGGTKKPSMRALLPEATAIVKNSNSITIPELGKALNAVETLEVVRYTGYAR